MPSSPVKRPPSATQMAQPRMTGGRLGSPTPTSPRLPGVGMGGMGDVCRRESVCVTVCMNGESSKQAVRSPPPCIPSCQQLSPVNTDVTALGPGAGLCQLMQYAPCAACKAACSTSSSHLCLR
eukprot:1159084-Pelagomonas_calceolata.AAC.14